VLSYVHGPFPNSINDNAPSIMCGVLVKSEKTEVRIRATSPTQDLESTQATIERIVESMRMP
jgi:hypothetical protein